MEVQMYLLTILGYMCAITFTGITGVAAKDNIVGNDSSSRSWFTSQCPRKCTCDKRQLSLARHNIPSNKFLYTVDCSGEQLTSPPSSLPENTEVFFIANNSFGTIKLLSKSDSLLYLDMSNSSLESISGIRFFAQYPQLKYLNLKRNSLKTVPNDTFNKLDHLLTFDLSFNDLENMYSESLLGLKNLKSLDLSHNHLKTVTSTWFSSMYELRELDLSHNEIVQIEMNSFQNLENLNLLNLSNNKIRRIGHSAFNVLKSLFVLDLGTNCLQFVPTIQLQSTYLLKKVSLNGNLIHKLHPGDFNNISVISLTLSFMNELTVVEKFSFQNMQYLTNLEMHDNPKLMFIDGNAFKNVPKLKTLYFHNNRLSVLPSGLPQSVPSLQDVHLYHNPVRCDCNALWIRDLVEEAKEHNFSKPFFSHPNFIKCAYPINVTGLSLPEVDESQFSRVCAPVTLPSFHENYTLGLGEELRLECHSYGIPSPQLIWLLPNGSEISNSTSSRKIEIIDKYNLVVRFLSVEDSGTYECKARNEVGFDISSTKVTVTNKPVRLVLLNLSVDYISLTWNGTQHNSMISDYQLHYKEIKGVDNQTQSSYRILPLDPQYRSYKVTHLKPGTNYEFCLVYVYDTEYYKVDCETFATKSKYLYQSAIKKIVSEQIIAGVCTALGITMAIACMVTLVRKFRIHKDYELPYGAGDEPEGIHIPLQNVYNPLSTPLCSSKTSLLSTHTSKSNFDEY
ncbi:leucine-rich repeat neuronal protein 1-like [Mya arenaria]|uniref:leucine-rich repeat neuronal protein 1-like n=1 Tax=Mya arenaria TaxID=6604 RepID=UPI0022DEAF53|nr:leucine-rich repeat neuronal protein 1-like [Mya arenaria]XP_052779893.1 leucine-rich repeat neuronal protein 1-like [Mya arenaria]